MKILSWNSHIFPSSSSLSFLFFLLYFSYLFPFFSSLFSSLLFSLVFFLSFFTSSSSHPHLTLTWAVSKWGRNGALLFLLVAAGCGTLVPTCINSNHLSSELKVDDTYAHVSMRRRENHAIPHLHSNVPMRKKWENHAVQHQYSNVPMLWPQNPEPTWVPLSLTEQCMCCQDEFAFT